MSIIKIESFKYLVVETGYTSRLLKEFDQFKEQVQVQLDEEEDQDCILYIHDSIWGSGLYKISPNNEEIEKVQKAVASERRAVVVFRCEDFGRAMCLVDVLIEQQYCACFDFTSLCGMELINGEILVMKFDCESG